MFLGALECLALRGRLVEIAATGQREVSFDLADFYHNESRLFGVATLKRDLAASAQVLDETRSGIRRRRLSRRAHRRDLRARRRAGGLSQGRGGRGWPHCAAAAGLVSPS
jgi:NADPH:quinone reductase-like Zn-dependent oxidoreductase